MVAVIENLLDKDQIKTIATKLFSAEFVDGSISGGPLGKGNKKNTQVSPNDPSYREMANQVMQAMQRNDQFNAYAMPRRILAPLFASYVPGEKYGSHIDATLMGPYPGMRTDLSITIFLNDPDAYDGGDLILETPFGEQSFKRKAGDAIIYPTYYLHRVEPVKSGRRLAIVTWVESMVADAGRREILQDFAEVMDMLVERNAERDVLVRLEKGRLNLMKMWAIT